MNNKFQNQGGARECSTIEKQGESLLLLKVFACNEHGDPLASARLEAKSSYSLVCKIGAWCNRMSRREDVDVVFAVDKDDTMLMIPLNLWRNGTLSSLTREGY